MISSDYTLRPIGVIRTEYHSSKDTPIQSCFSHSIGQAVVFNEFASGLMSLDMFSHIYLIYWFHKTMKPNLVVTPYLDSQQHGVFSTRAPSRPNPIGISVVELIEIDKETIIFRGADMLDGTPLLDIKPYVPVFDCRVNATEGWLKGKISFREEDKVADERFEIS